MTKRMRAGIPAVGLGLAAALLLLTGCSGAGTDAADGGGDTEDRSFASAEDATDGAAVEGNTGTKRGGRGGSANRSAVVTKAEISTATLTMASDDVRVARNAVQHVVDALRGEVADEETTSDDGELVWTRMVLRVPAESFEEAIGRLEGIGRHRDTDRSTEDVTTRVIDNQARLRAQERSLRRVELLLDRAQDLSDIVAIESELTRRQAELDSLKQQQAWLSDQTSMSTITVHLDHERDAATSRDDDSGFLAGLRAGWDSLRGAAVLVATAAGALLPWLVVLGLLGVPAWWALSRLGRRTQPRGGGERPDPVG